MSKTPVCLFKYDDEIDFNKISIIMRPKKSKTGTKSTVYDIFYENDKGVKCLLLIQTPTLTAPFGACSKNSYNLKNNLPINNNDIDSYSLPINLPVDDDEKIKIFVDKINMFETLIKKFIMDNYVSLLPNNDKLEDKTPETIYYMVYKFPMIKKQKAGSEKYGKKMKFKLPVYKDKNSKNNEKPSENVGFQILNNDKELIDCYKVENDVKLFNVEILPWKTMFEAIIKFDGIRIMDNGNDIYASWSIFKLKLCKQVSEINDVCFKDDDDDNVKVNNTYNEENEEDNESND